MICAAIEGERLYHELEGYPPWFTIVQYSFTAEWYRIESRPILPIEAIEAYFDPWIHDEYRSNRNDAFHTILEPHRLVTIS